MEKQQPVPNDVVSEMSKLKIDSDVISQDACVGGMLEVNATPEMERRILWKLDLL